ncbi:MAG TPA: 50S ribosomal protein L23 [Gemmatimonadales bacterium]|jgi:large subunit ribosomal protein L23
MPERYGVVVMPVVTEKASAAHQQHKEYAFRTHPEATKTDIRLAIEALFGVTVVRVRTMQQRMQKKSMGKTTGRTTRWKKAYVRLKDGETIPGIFEG